MGLSWGLVFETGSSSIVFYNRIVFKRCFETVLVWTRCLDYPNELEKNRNGSLSTGYYNLRWQRGT
jgi:hypothetical protein